MTDETASAEASYGALQDQERKALAYNALSAAYGPAIAYSPENAFNAAKASVAQQTIPQQVQQTGATLDLTKAQTGLASSEAAKNTTISNAGNLDLQTRGLLRDTAMLGLSKQPDGSLPQGLVRNYLQKNSQALGIDPSQIEPLVAQGATPAQIDQKTGKVINPGGAALLDALHQNLVQGGKIQGAIHYVQDVDGNMHAQFIQGGGVQDVNEGGMTNAPLITANVGAKVRPENAVSARIAATQPKGLVVSDTGPVYAVGGGRATPVGVNSIQGPQGKSNVVEQEKVGAAKGVNEANALPQNVAIARTALGQADLQFGRATDAIDNATRLAGPLTTGLAGRVSEAVGTPARRALDAQISTIKSNVAIAVSQLARVDKNAPFAVRNLQEFKAIQDNLGALDPSASNFPDQLAKTKQSLSDLQGVLHEKYSATYGPSVLDHGVAPPGTPRTGRPNQPVDFRTYFSGSP